MKTQTTLFIFLFLLTSSIVVVSSLGVNIPIETPTTSGGGGSNPFDQSLNTTNQVEFKKITLTSNTPTGGISKLIQLNMNTTYDRPWIAWYDEFGKLRVATGYHTTDYNSGNNHTAFEIKTSTDPITGIPNDMITRFSVGAEANLTNATFNALDKFALRDDSSTLFQFDTSNNVLTLGDGTNVVSSIIFSGRAEMGYNGANLYHKASTGKGILMQVSNSINSIYLNSGGVAKFYKDVVMDVLAGSYTGGSAYVCVYDNGTLFASEVACP